MSETLQCFIREESTSSGRNAGLEAKARATLMRAEALPPVSLEIDDSIIIRSAPRMQPNGGVSSKGAAGSLSLNGATESFNSKDAAEYTLNVPLDGLDLPPDLLHCRNDYTLVSLRLGASVIDRSQSFDVVVRCIKELQRAVERFNLANSNVLATSILYKAIEGHYANDYPTIPQAMGKITESMLSPAVANRA
ncbi:hypothetical protein BKA70DRAFT_1241288 [Coprinopsis sp. MPI-PUGE-AT-0042]|nr:hypothetical protein BKA70DRAFT_1241288 [Coprinopsis sp. MPI-PUGE-AT-0042]